MYKNTKFTTHHNGVCFQEKVSSIEACDLILRKMKRDVIGLDIDFHEFIRCGAIQANIKKCFHKIENLGYLIISKELSEYINEYYFFCKEDGFRIDKAFNDLDEDFKNNVNCIICPNQGLTYFPVLKGFNNLKSVDCRDNKLDEKTIKKLKGWKKERKKQNKDFCMKIESPKEIKSERNISL